MRLTGDGDHTEVHYTAEFEFLGFRPGTSSRCSRCRSSGSVTTPRSSLRLALQRL